MDDWIFNDELKFQWSDLVAYSAATAMIVGGVIPYVPQYKQIKRTQDPEGFSLLVCLTLLIANTLRILFWFSKRFELPLLIQSIVMNLTMFLMIHLCVKVRRNNAIMKTRDRVFAGNDMVEGHGSNMERVEDNGPASGSLKRRPSKHYLSDFDTRYFWAWTDFQSYLDFMLVFWAAGAAVTYLLLNVEWFMETVGFLALFTEAMLGTPQFLRNFRNKSTAGMSMSMVVMWTLGDIFKTVYFVAREAPMQFWICGTLQVTLDIAILIQVYIYRKNSAPRNVHRGD
ncbi:solute carrier family 66 member 2 isoform X1 [Bradysia coprophila]|uniref:solute carrier family 66 member 2 isoform X1 n=1 Tax=Bradysia coprophila TaxID=38358 RepID=UPI00187DCBEF|nr:solute carrier family 66 member 2 isoform X1 [Bradysia coprophila]